MLVIIFSFLKIYIYIHINPSLFHSYCRTRLSWRLKSLQEAMTTTYDYGMNDFSPFQLTTRLQHQDRNQVYHKEKRHWSMWLIAIKNHILQFSIIKQVYHFLHFDSRQSWTSCPNALLHSFLWWKVIFITDVLCDATCSTWLDRFAMLQASNKQSRWKFWRVSQGLYL